MKSQPWEEFVKKLEGERGDQALEQAWKAMQHVFKNLNPGEYPKIYIATQDAEGEPPHVYGEQVE